MSPRYLFIVLAFCAYTSLVIAKRGGGGSFGRGSGRTGGSYYPPSSGLSGTNTHSVSNSYAYGHSNAAVRTGHNYPQTTGLSGNSQRSHSTSYVQKSEVHHHYHYSPPQHISYGSQPHPVFQGQPPVYVYEYRNSGSRFDTLLTGLALYNLGRISNSHSHNYHSEYRGTPGETCKLVISKSNGEYEETRIDCKLISSFIWDVDSDQNKVATNVISNRVDIMQTVNYAGNTTVTFQNTNVIEALQVKGPSIAVTPGMSCFMIRISKHSSMLKRRVDCALLQQYAVKSLRYNRCTRLIPVISIFISSFIINL